jgi:hypothetical protein
MHGVAVGEAVDVAVDFLAPVKPGRYASYWSLASPSGKKFGQRIWVLIEVTNLLLFASVHVSYIHLLIISVLNGVQVEPIQISVNKLPAINLNLPPAAKSTELKPLIDKLDQLYVRLRSVAEPHGLNIFQHPYVSWIRCRTSIVLHCPSKRTTAPIPSVWLQQDLYTSMSHQNFACQRQFSGWLRFNRFLIYAFLHLFPDASVSRFGSIKFSHSRITSP